MRIRCSTGTASFELEPPDEAEMARRMQALLDGGYPYIVAEIGGAIAGYAYAGSVPAAAGLSLQRRGFDLRRPQRAAARRRPRAAGAPDRGMRAPRLSPDDRGDRRFGANAVDRAAPRARVSHDRHGRERRLQVRPLARQRADAARARAGRDDQAAWRASAVIPERSADRSPSRNDDSGHTATKLGPLSSTRSTRSSSWPRRTIRPVADTTL